MNNIGVNRKRSGNSGQIDPRGNSGDNDTRTGACDSKLVVCLIA